MLILLIIQRENPFSPIFINSKFKFRGGLMKDNYGIFTFDSLLGILILIGVGLICYFINYLWEKYEHSAIEKKQKIDAIHARLGGIEKDLEEIKNKLDN